MDTLIISILSGLAGACITAFFNFRIRLKLLDKERKKKEYQIAYVYVVQLSQYPAMQVWFQSLLRQLLDQLDAPLPSDGIEFKHVLSVLIEDLISDADDSFFETIKNIDKFADPILNLFVSTAPLTQEQQANLPKETVLIYQQYEECLKSTFAYIEMLKVSLPEKKLLKLFTSEQIGNFIETVIQLFNYASQLRAVMRIYGGISDKESEYLLTQKYELLCKRVSNSGTQKEYIKKARDFLHSKGAERPAKTKDKKPKLNSNMRFRGSLSKSKKYSILK